MKLAARALAVFAAVVAVACQSGDSASDTAPAPAAGCSGTVLFGRPNAKTGLDDTQCQPRCTCSGVTFEAPLYGQADIDALLAWKQLDPPAMLSADPYASPAPDVGSPDRVCAVVRGAEPKTYRVQTFESEAAAKAAGAIPTHYGPCGLCSSLANLAVYMRYPDLTAPVRDCGLKGVSGDAAAQLACIGALGFEPPCAQIWSYNTDATRAACFDTCISVLGKPYHQEDGSLNACLQCDEDKSGPVFKAVAGRTRRNTGLGNALCRPCSEVRPLLHHYD